MIQANRPGIHAFARRLLIAGLALCSQAFAAGTLKEVASGVAYQAIGDYSVEALNKILTEELASSATSR